MPNAPCARVVRAKGTGSARSRTALPSPRDRPSRSVLAQDTVEEGTSCWWGAGRPPGKVRRGGWRDHLRRSTLALDASPRSPAAERGTPCPPLPGAGGSPREVAGPRGARWGGGDGSGLRRGGGGGAGAARQGPPSAALAAPRPRSRREWPGRAEVGRAAPPAPVIAPRLGGNA